MVDLELLEKLEKLEKAASQAPWRYSPKSIAAGATQAHITIPWDAPFPFDPHGDQKGYQLKHTPTIGLYPTRVYFYVYCKNPDCDGCPICDAFEVEPEYRECHRREYANLELIAAARNALPALIAEVRGLRETLAAAKRCNEELWVKIRKLNEYSNTTTDTRSDEG